MQFDGGRCGCRPGRAAHQLPPLARGEQLRPPTAEGEERPKAVADVCVKGGVGSTRPCGTASSPTYNRSLATLTPLPIDEHPAERADFIALHLQIRNSKSKI